MVAAAIAAALIVGGGRRRLLEQAVELLCRQKHTGRNVKGA